MLLLGVWGHPPGKFVLRLNLEVILTEITSCKTHGGWLLFQALPNNTCHVDLKVDQASHNAHMQWKVRFLHSTCS